MWIQNVIKMAIYKSLKTYLCTIEKNHKIGTIYKMKLEMENGIGG